LSHRLHFNFNGSGCSIGFGNSSRISLGFFGQSRHQFIDLIHRFAANAVEAQDVIGHFLHLQGQVRYGGIASLLQDVANVFRQAAVENIGLVGAGGDIGVRLANFNRVGGFLGGKANRAALHTIDELPHLIIFFR